MAAPTEVVGSSGVFGVWFFLFFQTITPKTIAISRRITTRVTFHGKTIKVMLASSGRLFFAP